MKYLPVVFELQILSHIITPMDLDHLNLENTVQATPCFKKKIKQKGMCVTHGCT